VQIEGIAPLTPPVSLTEVHGQRIGIPSLARAGQMYVKHPNVARPETSPSLPSDATLRTDLLPSVCPGSRCSFRWTGQKEW
jgi:hypothetical protein